VDAAPMINRCYRHQHPEVFDRPAVEPPRLPAGLRYGGEHVPSSRAQVEEEPMGSRESRLQSWHDWVRMGP